MSNSLAPISIGTLISHSNPPDEFIVFCCATALGDWLADMLEDNALLLMLDGEDVLSGGKAGKYLQRFLCLTWCGTHNDWKSHSEWEWHCSPGYWSDCCCSASPWWEQQEHSGLWSLGCWSCSSLSSVAHLQSCFEHLEQALRRCSLLVP